MLRSFWTRFTRIALATAGAFCPIVWADNNAFVLYLTIDGVAQEMVSFNNAEQAAHYLDGSNLDGAYPSYTDTSAIILRLDFRGLDFALRFPSHSNVLTVNIPGTSISNKTFGATCADRDCAVDEFVDWLKNNRDGLTNEIFQALAAASPIDPVAGNESSLMSTMVESVGDQTMFVSAYNNTAAKTESPIDNFWGTEFDYSSYDTAYGSVERIRIPITYTFKFDGDVRKEMVVQAPISRTKINATETYALPLTIIYRHPINNSWVLLPALTWGVTYNEDLGGGGQMAGLSLSSSYSWNFGDNILTMGNMVGKMQSRETSAGDFTIDPDINETVIKNGLLWSMPNVIFGKYLMEFFAVNTQTQGDDIYIDEYNIIGVTVGKDRSEVGRRNRWALGVKVFRSDQEDSTSFNVSYWF